MELINQNFHNGQKCKVLVKNLDEQFPDAGGEGKALVARECCETERRNGSGAVRIIIVRRSDLTNRAIPTTYDSLPVDGEKKLRDEYLAGWRAGRDSTLDEIARSGL